MQYRTSRSEGGACTYLKVPLATSQAWKRSSTCQRVLRQAGRQANTDREAKMPCENHHESQEKLAVWPKLRNKVRLLRKLREDFMHLGVGTGSCPSASIFEASGLRGTVAEGNVPFALDDRPSLIALPSCCRIVSTGFLIASACIHSVLRTVRSFHRVLLPMVSTENFAVHRGNVASFTTCDKEQAFLLWDAQNCTKMARRIIHGFPMLSTLCHCPHPQSPIE